MYCQKCCHLIFTDVHPHYATRQNATHCSFAMWQKSLGICRQFDLVHIKRNFFADYFRLQKLQNETSKLCLIFFYNWLMPFWNPLLIICRTANLWWDRHFADWIFTPHGMPRHAEALPKPCCIDVHIILAICRMAKQHAVAWLCSKSCSAYAANLIASTLKKNFLQTILHVTKTVERDQWISSDFFF